MNPLAPALVVILAVSGPHALTAAEAPPAVPAAFTLAGQQPYLTLQAVGAQIYACKAMPDGSRTWAFREPIATLIEDGRTVGRHYAGPNWEADGGGVTGKAVASAPGATPADIPQLQLEVVAHRDAGPLAAARTVLRLHTVGGVLAGPCETIGALRGVPYTADYVFLK